MHIEKHARALVRRWLYPLSWVWIVFALDHFLAMEQDRRPAWILITLPLLVVFLVVEILLPLERRWSMTWRNLVTDLVYVALAGAAITLVATGLALLSITIAGTTNGPARDWPLWLQVPVLLLVFEFLNYWIHRSMHRLGGQVGAVLWRVHAAHHLPRGLYLLMHAVSHPINALLVQSIAIILPISLMGYRPDAVLIFLVVNAFHGIISHFNVDLRMGLANRIFVGPELHRYHHSADPLEAMNYGATLSVWDQVFGTFVYRPQRSPAALGVRPAQGFPEYRQVLRVLGLPFRRAPGSVASIRRI